MKSIHINDSGRDPILHLRAEREKDPYTVEATRILFYFKTPRYFGQYRRAEVLWRKIIFHAFDNSFRLVEAAFSSAHPSFVTREYFKEHVFDDDPFIFTEEDIVNWSYLFSEHDVSRTPQSIIFMLEKHTVYNRAWGMEKELRSRFTVPKDDEGDHLVDVHVPLGHLLYLQFETYRTQ